MGQPFCLAAAGLVALVRTRLSWAPGKALRSTWAALAGSRPYALRHAANHSSLPFALRTIRQAGFTLIELMVALSVLAILAAAAVPNFSSFIHRSRMTTESSNLVSDVEIARSEAARRNTTITVCPTADGTNCTSDWTQRRVVFVDSNGDNIISNGEEVIRKSDPPASSMVIVASSLSTGATSIRLRSWGAPDSLGSWQFCEKSSTSAGQRVSLTGSGKPTSQQVACP